MHDSNRAPRLCWVWKYTRQYKNKSVRVGGFDSLDLDGSEKKEQTNDKICMRFNVENAVFSLV